LSPGLACFREKLDALIAAKLEGKALTETAAPRLAPMVNLLDALQRNWIRCRGSRS